MTGGLRITVLEDDGVCHKIAEDLDKFFALLDTILVTFPSL